MYASADNDHRWPKRATKIMVMVAHADLYVVLSEMVIYIQVFLKSCPRSVNN